METTDTVKLLRECDAGVKMAVFSIDEVLDKVSKTEFKELLIGSKNHHAEIGNKIHSLLEEHGSKEKEPNPIAKGMSWIKTNAQHSSDSAAADFITDGCNMGIKSLNKYLNQYKAADSTSQKLCTELSSIEEQLVRDVRCYL